MKIVFLCPPATTINGGIKQIFRMAETLIAQGHDTVVFEQTRTRPAWFASTAPLVGQEIFQAAGDAVYVLPEDQPHILRDFAALPQRKVIYSQNHFYGALGLGDGGSYAAFGINAILCASPTIYAHCRARHPDIAAHLVTCGVDPTLFSPAAAKQETIALMPRKRPIEAAYLRDLFRFRYPALARWRWAEIADASEAEVARAMGSASVFLALGRLEGLGLAPLEAMAAGCVVAGFTGGGGRDYATADNGFWVADDDCDACVGALHRAVMLASSGDEQLAAYRAACGGTLDDFTPAGFAQAVKVAWERILNG